MRRFFALSLLSFVACHSGRSSKQYTVIDAADTAAYSQAGSEAVAAVAKCKRPRCRPDIFRDKASGDLTVGLDSGTNAEMQWIIRHESVPGGAAFQDSAWRARLSAWETSKNPPLLLVDGNVTTYADARARIAMADVWGVKQIESAEARTLSTDPRTANGAVVITTKAHAPKQ